MGFLDKMRRQKLLSLSLLVFTLSIGIVIGTVVNTGVFAARAQNSAPDASLLVIPPATQNTNELAKLVKRIEPAVVNISMDFTAKPTTSSKLRPGRPAPQSDDEEDNGDGMDLFRKFFRNGIPDNTPQRPYKGGGTGSGFVVDKNGYIITNNHVVEKADHIKVKFPHDQTEYRARLIGTDVETDVAVIKIDAGHPLQTIRIGNSDGVEVGDTAIAIGSPFGLEASVTSGIISATGRDLAGAQQFQRFIQTDAAINPGNSGGPLLNGNGEVIGVNTLIATQSGGYQGIGFALPINTAVHVYNSIIRTGKVARGSIGIKFQKTENSATLMKALGLKEGVIVDSVMPGGPADRAGLKADDVIVGFNGKSVKDGDDLVMRVSETPIGSSASVTVDRNGQRLDKKLVIGSREEQLAASDDPRYPKRDGEEPGRPEEKAQTQVKFGIQIRPLNEAEKENSSIPEKRGVMVTQVQEGSFGEEIGLQERDIIVSINRQPVNTFEDVRRIQNSLKTGDAIAFRVLRGAPTPGRNGAKGVVQYQGFWLSGTLPAQ
jgi:serine protease Do